MRKASIGRRNRWRLGVVAASLLALGTAVPAAEARPAPAGDAAIPAAYLYVPINGGRAVARWDGKAAGYTLAKARSVLPGRFDAQGGGAFIYRAGSAPDGILRIRQSGGELSLSLRTESVNGHFEPITGDFDGNGFTDILWTEVAGYKSYLWSFRADGSHRSVPFDTGFDGTVVRQAMPLDANLDGIDDLYWLGTNELWIMKADGTHTVRGISINGQPGYSGFVSGNLGPADGVTRRRLAAIYEGGYERLITFNGAGQSTMKVVRPHTGNCCTYQRAVGGRFRSGYARTLFFYDGFRPEGTEYLQDFTPGGNRLETAAPQINGSYTPTVDDFDGNGFDDILLWNRAGTTYLLSSDGTTFTSSNPADVPARSIVVAVPMS